MKDMLTKNFPVKEETISPVGPTWKNKKIQKLLPWFYSLHLTSGNIGTL